jgi:hypothetical protein
VTARGGALRIAGHGDSIDALRALCTASWAEGVRPIDPADDVARSALSQLGIPAAD